MPKYNSIENIPAKVFYDIINAKDYNLLKPKPKETGLKDVFMSIYDEWFIKSNNENAKRYLDLRNEIGFLTYKINVIKKTIQFLHDFPLPKIEMLLGIVEVLKKECNIHINIENNISQELKEVLRVQVGSLEFELFQLKTEFDSYVNANNSEKIDFYKKIAYLSDILPNNPLLSEKMSLAVEISLENLAKEKIQIKTK